jgi:1-acyl-sn-glycerol-3-phosphate acyltransferase
VSAPRHQDLRDLHERIRRRGVNPLVYWPVRVTFQPFFHLYFRLRRSGLEHVPKDGPVIFASNHRSTLDPFLVGTLSRRPIYYVAKREHFIPRLRRWFFISLGAFPVDRGASDEEMVATAKAILGRGDALLIFPEGTRVRPGPLGRARRGVGRLAVETGATIVPLAIVGSEDARRGWRIRPRRIRMGIARAIPVPHEERASPQLARAVTERVWQSVCLQWEALGGMPPLRRAAVLGDGPWAAATAELLERAGVEVAGEGDLAGAEVVVLAVPPAELARALHAHAARMPGRAGVLLAVPGPVPPDDELSADLAARRLGGRPVAVLAGPAEPDDLRAGAPRLLVAGSEGALVAQLRDALRAAGARVRTGADVAEAERAAWRARGGALGERPAGRVAEEVGPPAPAA